MSNVLETEYTCNGVKCTWATPRNPPYPGPPTPETPTALAVRHKAELEAAKENCDEHKETLGSQQSHWTWAEGNATYASDDSYPKADHDADVAAIKLEMPPI